MTSAADGRNGRDVSAADKLTARQEDYLAALVGTGSAEQAAKAARVSDRTGRRWQARPAFRKALRGARARAFDAQTAAISQLSAEAVEVLRRAMRLEVPPAIQVRAAGVVLHLVFRNILIDDLMADVENLRLLLERSRRPDHLPVLPPPADPDPTDPDEDLADVT